MKLITAFIVVCALILPKMIDKQREKQRKKRRMSNALQKVNESGEQLAAIKSNS